MLNLFFASVAVSNIFETDGVNLIVVRTVMSISCQVNERPSKEDWFCFKLFHPIDQSRWPSDLKKIRWNHGVSTANFVSYLSSIISTSAAEGESQKESAASEMSSHETQWSEAAFTRHLCLVLEVSDFWNHDSFSTQYAINPNTRHMPYVQQ